MKVLSNADTATIRALAMCFLPRGGGIEHDAVDAGVLPFIDNWCAKLRPFEVLRIRALFRLFEHYIAVENLSPFARFSTAERDDQIAYLSTWENSSVYARRLAFQGVRSIITLAYDQHPGVQQQMGLGQSEEHLCAQADRLAEAAAMLSGAKPTRPGPAAASATPRRPVAAKRASEHSPTGEGADTPSSDSVTADAEQATGSTKESPTKKKPTPKKASAKKSPASKASAKKASVKKASAKKAPAKKAGAAKPAAKKTRAASSAIASDAPAEHDTPKPSNSQAS